MLRNVFICCIALLHILLMVLFLCTVNIDVPVSFFLMSGFCVVELVLVFFGCVFLYEIK